MTNAELYIFKKEQLKALKSKIELSDDIAERAYLQQMANELEFEVSQLSQYRGEK